MTDHSVNRKIHLVLGIQSGLKTVDYLAFSSGPSESLKPDRFFCALMVSHYLYNCMIVVPCDNYYSLFFDSSSTFTCNVI